MRIHAFNVLLKNGDSFTCGEWGRTWKSAVRAIFSAYGENIEALSLVRVGEEPLTII